MILFENCCYYEMPFFVGEEKEKKEILSTIIRITNVFLNSRQSARKHAR